MNVVGVAALAAFVSLAAALLGILGNRSTRLRVRVPAIHGLHALEVEKLLQDAGLGILRSGFVDRFYSDERVLITSATSQLGTALAHRLLDSEVKELVLVDQHMDALSKLLVDMRHGPATTAQNTNLVGVAGDISDRRFLDELRDHTMPGTIIHVLNPVPEGVARSRSGIIRDNLLATQRLVAWAADYSDRLILCSGLQSDLAETLQSRACRAAEDVVLDWSQKTRSTTYAVIRVGKLLSVREGLLGWFQNSAATGRPVLVPHPDHARRYVTPSAAAELILSLPQYLGEGRAFVIEGTPISTLRLAETAIRSVGREPYQEVPVVYTGTESPQDIFEDIPESLPTELPALRVLNNREPQNVAGYYWSEMYDRGEIDLIDLHLRKAYLGESGPPLDVVAATRVPT